MWMQSHFAQTTFIQDHFENASAWTSSGTTSPNNWIIGSCTNNGGNKALYISAGGSTNDCSPTGIAHYGYTNAVSGVVSVITSREIQATCFTAMQMHADIQIEGEMGTDFLEVVYSTDLGASWTVIGAAIVANSTYTTSNFNLPAALNNSVFLLGFRFTYNDSNIGNKAPAIDNFSVEGTSSDLVAPSITCPSPISNYTDDYCDFILPDYTALATVSDACGIISLSQTPPIGSVVNETTTITLQATDGSGNNNTCTFQLTLIDTVKPKVFCPAVVYSYLNSSCVATTPDIIAVMTAEEYCTPTNLLVFSQNPVINSIVTSDQNVFVTVTDLAGNSGVCFTHVILRDTIAPTITCPATQTVSTDNGCTYDMTNFTGLVTASDNCSGTVLLNQTPSIGNSLPLGPTTITIEALDAQGNESTCQFTLNIQDQVAPILLCPTTPHEIPANSQCEATLGNLVPLISATDNCTGSTLIQITQNLPESHVFSGTIQVIMTGTDESGNSGTCLFDVQIIDTTGPAVTCLIDTSLNISGTCTMTVPNLAGTHQAVDNCSPANTLTFTQNPIAGTVITNPVHIVITYTDPAGNSGTCSTFTKPIEAISPTITCPSAQTLNNGNSCSALLPDLTGLAVVSDNCTGWSVTQQPVPNTPLLSGTHVITLTATDAAGNSTLCTTSYSIHENINPVITCPNAISTCNPLVNYTAPVGSDNCQFVITQTDLSGLSSGSIFPIGTTTQTYLITDSSGNTASCSFNVQVIEYPDTAFIPNSLVYLCDVDSTTIEAQVIQSGTGSWSVLSGPGTINTPNATQTAVENLSLGINEFVWTVTSPTCGSRKDTLRIVVNMPPPQAQLTDSLFACSNTNYIIQGNSPGAGTGTWTSNSPIVFNNIHAPVASLLSIPDGFHTLYWTISLNGCPSTVDSCIVYAPHVAKVLTNDTSICIEKLPFDISGTIAGPGQAAYWIPLTGSGNLTNKYNANSQLTAASPGTLSYIYRLTHTHCSSTQDTLRIEITSCGGDFEFDIPTVFTPNKDGDNDFFFIPNLHEIAPDCELVIINRWGAKVFESKGYSDPWDGTFKGNEAPLGTYFYEIISPSNSFKPIKGSISIIR